MSPYSNGVASTLPVEGLQHLRVVLKITKGAPVESQLRLKFKAKRQKTTKGLEKNWTIRNQTPDVLHTFLRLPFIRLFLHFCIAEFCGHDPLRCFCLRSITPVQVETPTDRTTFLEERTGSWWTGKVFCASH